MHKAVLRKVGRSVMLALPPTILELLHVQAGATVQLAVDGSRLVIEGTPRPRYRLDELLAECDPTAYLAAEDREWVDAKPAGGELI